ncbi:MAG: Eco57I restriction-modification methylase domain-containing protein [Pseudomonadota bacterium]
MPASTIRRNARPLDPALLAKLPLFKGSLLPALVRAEQVRTTRHARVDRDHKMALGQFLTPAATARFAASFFQTNARPIRLLDAGAGAGALLAACLERFGTIDKVDAVETDAELLVPLAETVAAARRGGARVRIVSDCFMRWSLDCPGGGGPRYTHAILNPPYGRLPAGSATQTALREASLHVSNTYTAFVALALRRLLPGGELVAILPRSFFAGPTHIAFRRWLLDRAALRRIHLFERRDAIFRDDGVLQEIVMVHLRRGVGQGPVTVSTSTDDSFSDLVATKHPPSAVFRPGDARRCIRIPTPRAAVPLDARAGFDRTLSDMGVSVSTGPVIKSRVRGLLRPADAEDALPLLHTSHHVGPDIAWPSSIGRDDDALATNAPVRLTYPRGHYVLVRRYSFKEAPRRVMAALLRPKDLPAGTARFSVQDRYNILHVDRAGLPDTLAAGLTAYLGTTLVDEHVRSVSGTTQINATDLRTLPCPSRDILTALGVWAVRQPSWPDSSSLDDRLASLMQEAATPDS